MKDEVFQTEGNEAHEVPLYLLILPMSVGQI
jgi:hypothetical protein